MRLFDFQPHLSDELVSLRPLEERDWTGLLAAGSDPLIWEHHPAHDRWREANFRQFFDQAIASKGALLITDRQSGDVIGASRFDVTRAGAGEAEIGWTFLARRYWGGKTNASVKRLMIDHLLRSFDRAIFLIGADNVRSRRALEKIGGVLTERLVVVDVEGAPVQHVVYSIDRQAFSRTLLQTGG